MTWPDVGLLGLLAAPILALMFRDLWLSHRDAELRQLARDLVSLIDAHLDRCELSPAANQLLDNADHLTRDENAP